TEGSMQLSFKEDGTLLHTDWIEIVKAATPYYWMRLGGGVLYFTGIILCVVNVVMTIRGGKFEAEEPAEAPALTAERPHDELIGEALAEKDSRERGHKLHALLERWPTAFTLLTALALAV